MHALQGISTWMHCDVWHMGLAEVGVICAHVQPGGALIFLHVAATAPAFPRLICQITSGEDGTVNEQLLRPS
jgi:hypothetical protein